MESSNGTLGFSDILEVIYLKQGESKEETTTSSYACTLRPHELMTTHLTEEAMSDAYSGMFELESTGAQWNTNSNALSKEEDRRELYYDAFPNGEFTKGDSLREVSPFDAPCAAREPHESHVLQNETWTEEPHILQSQILDQDSELEKLNGNFDYCALNHIFAPFYYPSIYNKYAYCDDNEVSETPSDRMQPTYLFLKDPPPVRVVNSPRNSVLDEGKWAKVKKQTTNLLEVSFRFQNYREAAAAMFLSGTAKEYQLPIFSILQPFRVLRQLPQYQGHRNLTDSHVVVARGVGFRVVTIKRYKSRLTAAQTAIILGLQNYSVSLTRYIEAAIFAMLEQMCQFRVGDRTWCNGYVREERRTMITRVTPFIQVYFPMLTPELVEVIIKRGSYSRTQSFLKRRRRLSMGFKKGNTGI